MGATTIQRVFALDPAMRNTGWACGSTDGARPTWGVFQLPSWGTEEGKHLHSFKKFLDRTITDYRPDVLFYEDGFIGAQGSISQSSKAQMNGLIWERAYVYNVRLFKVPIGSWRKRFLGTTKAPPHERVKRDGNRKWLKQKAVEVCSQRGWLVEDDNAAEALGIMDFGLACISTEYAGKTDSIFRRLEFTRDREGAVG